MRIGITKRQRRDKIDMVKPIPHSTPTAMICLNAAPCGSFASPRRNASQQKRDTDGFTDKQASNDSQRQHGRQPASVTPSSDTPALAKANSGRISQDTQGEWHDH
jgi:hypothetical protein